ncbi:hypothetical protein PN465_01475 [Nodularia spumigena CS-584]|nr:hypothetical protein [Nodularia spumigena CS-584]
MTRHLLLIFTIYSFSLFGQSYDAHLSNIIPPSPEAFNFTKFGDIPLNECSGLANLNVPIYNYNVGRIHVPLSLAYVTEGVKVDQMNGHVGMSWKLQAGGLITREVRDRPDNWHMSSADIQNRRFHSEQVLLSFVPPGPYYNNQQLYDLSRNWVDSEADIFNFSFGTYSGSFVLDENFTPHLLTLDKELKIQLISSTVNNLEIQITTPDGIKYFFGGPEASEMTMMKTGLGLFSDQCQTSFYLYKIQDFNGDEVYIEYLSNYSRKKIGYTQSFKKRYNSRALEFNYQPYMCINPGFDFHFDETLSLLSEGEIVLDAIGQNSIAKISSNRTTSKINFTSVVDNSAEVKRPILQEIIIIDENQAIFKKFKLNYTNSVQRYFLNSLQVFDKNYVLDYSYLFDYNDIFNLAPRFSYSQDHEGYYNGKSNANFIPQVRSDAVLALAGEFGNPIVFANRDADFNFASKGILKKITYPTKGYTEIEYESGKETRPLEFVMQNKILSVNYNTPANTSVKLNDSAPLVNGSTPATTINLSQPIEIRINATIKGPLSNFHKLKITLDDLNSETNDFVRIIDLENIVTNPGALVKTLDISYTFPNPSLTANFVTRLEYYRTDITSPYPTYPNYFFASAKIIYASNQLELKDKLGIRVKRIKHFSSQGELADQTRYYYNRFEDLTNQTDSQLLQNLPSYVSNDIEESLCHRQEAEGVYNCVTTLIESKTVRSSSLRSHFFTNGSRYKYVTTSYGGDNFEKGGKESEFSILNDSDVTQILNPVPFALYNHLNVAAVSNTGLTSGTLLKEQIFKLQNNFRKDVQQKEFIYLSKPEKSGYITNCFNKKIFLRNSCHRAYMDDGFIYYGAIDEYEDMYFNGSQWVPMTYNIRNIYFAVYKTFFKWFSLNKIITTNYFESGNVVAIEELLYNNQLAGLPSHKTTFGSEGTNTTRFYYPNDQLNDTHMPELVQANRIDVVKTENYFNGDKISETKTIYQNDTNSSGLLLPKYGYAAKFPNDLPLIPGIGKCERKITYDKYDQKGNILQYTPENGIPVTYVWGYNGLHPIAKIENATYDHVTQMLNIPLNSLYTLTAAPANIRQLLPEAMITTYTYKPLVGVTSITDPRGLITTFEYDSAGRLIQVRDYQGKILSENEYHYKNN